MKLIKRFIIVLLAIGLAILALWFFGERFLFQPTRTSLSSGVRVGDVESAHGNTADRVVRNVEVVQNELDEEPTVQPDVLIVAENLSVPWGVGFLSNGEILVTERTGELVHLSADGEELRRHTIESAGGSGEGGLLGLALHPNFENNRWLYLYETYDAEVGNGNRVIRFVYDGKTLSDRTTIITDIDGAVYHDGGRIAFGPDGMLYVTTGDATEPETAQDLNSLSGKILRLNDDGSAADGNPFANNSLPEIYSLGHRNPQGLAWDDAGRLWSTEHGRSGVKTGFDELNYIQPGKNYGWPMIEGDLERAGMISPAAHSGPTETWAPASAVYWDGSIWFGGLRGQSLYEAKLGKQLDGEKVTEVIAHFREDFGRIRTVTLNPYNNRFYITTSNTDGRAQPNAGDDKLISVNPEIFR